MSELNTATLPKLPPGFRFLPLPAITNADLARKVVTHASVNSVPKNSTSLEIVGNGTVHDYEKLEHVGDSILNSLVTTLLNDLYPQLPPGAATILKFHLINNATLAQLALGCGLVDRLIAAPAAYLTAVMQTKVQASMFEAYIAGVFYDFLVSECPAFALSFMHECVAKAQADIAEENDKDDPMNDSIVSGAAGALNGWSQKVQGTLPVYSSEMVGGNWRGVCTLKYKDQTLVGEAVRETKKGAWAVAAWKVCKQAGLRV